MSGYEGLEICIDMHIGPFVIVKAGASQRAIRNIESQRLDQMQSATGICTQTDNIAGVGRNLRLKEHYVKHEFAQSERLDNYQYDNGEQQQDREFVKPAIEHMTPGIFVLFELSNDSSTPQVVNNQYPD